jgi:hypothetical protein
MINPIITHLKKHNYADPGRGRAFFIVCRSKGYKKERVFVEGRGGMQR